MIKSLVPIIGRSSSGKSTLVEELSNRGYQTIKEVARGVLEERKHIPETLDENYIRQKIIFERQTILENSVAGLVFLDRSLIDGLGYANYFGLELDFVNKNLLKSRYDIVLELEKRPFIQDGLRIEKDERQVDEIYSRVKDNYSSLGYDFIFVPNFCSDRIYNAKQRADFILENLGDKI